MLAKDKGDIAEQLACQYLKKQGLKLITQNYRCRTGEIDLIMLDQNVLVFVEVRYRKQTLYGSALESVTKTKQSRIIKAAKHYLHTEKKHYFECRFDVIAINPNQSSNFDYNWIQHAFQAE